MELAGKARAKIFWLTDFVDRGSVRKNYIEIKNILEYPNSNGSEEIRALYLDRILKHAVASTPFYKYFKSFNSLDDFPIINKNIIKDKFIDLFSDKFKLSELYKVTTSGSTGAPLTVWQDKGKRNRHVAENIYFSELAGYPLGSRLYYLRVWNEINRKGKIKTRSQNLIMQDAWDLSDENLEHFIARLIKDKSAKSILAFSSTLEALAHYIQKNSIQIISGINCLIAISETLPQGAKEILERAFNCHVIARYSNMENGFLAQQCGDMSGEYHINTASYIFELLDLDSERLVKPGEIGRIVVTDLFNYAMPMVRYDTGDLAILEERSSCGKPGSVFITVEGRRVDFIYNTKGHLLSPHIITNTMWKYSQLIKQFQFIQNGPNTYLLKLNCDRSKFIKENELIDDLKNYLCNDAKIVIEYVNEIPRLASGKRKKIINNFIRK